MHGGAPTARPARLGVGGWGRSPHLKKSMAQNALRTSMLICALAVLAFVSGCAEPPSLSREADLLILDARVVTATGEVLDGASVVVSNGDIEDVVVGETVRIAETVIGGDGYTVVPGLIDTHVHLLMGSPTVDSDAAMDAYLDETLPALLDEYLATGFTTVLSNGDFWPVIADVKARVNGGSLRGPRLFILGPVFTAPGAHPVTTICADAPWCREHLVVEVDDEQQAREAVDQIAERGADGVKVIYDSGPNHPRLQPGLLRAIAVRASAHDLPVIVHTSTSDGVGDALGAGVARLAHSPLERMPDELVTRAVVAGVPVASTIRSGPFWEEPEGPSFEDRKANVRALLERGARVAFGTDNTGDRPVGASLAAEIEALQEAGLSPEQVIVALTSDAADYLGQSDNLGTIEVGKRADLLIVEGDPVTDPAALRNVVAVVKDGVLIVDYR